MKKILAVILSVLMLATFAACDSASKIETPSGEQAPAGNDSAVKLEGVSAPVDILNTVASSYADDERVPGEPMAVEDGDTDTLQGLLICSTEAIDMIDSAAHYVHMMMANNFTAGSYHLKDGVDKAAFVSAMQTAIQGNQWICGFPEKLVIATLADDYVVVAFGSADIIDNFKSKLTTAYDIAVIAVEEAIA